MADFVFGDIVLIAFPFVESGLVKKRPALVLIDTGDDDFIAARVTSQSPQSPWDIEIRHWEDAGLRLPSLTRMHKIATLPKQSVQRRLGKLDTLDKQMHLDTLKQLWNF